MNSTTLRSHCPITTGIDVIGDKWTLLIIRHMLFLQKYTYGQFLEIKEKIASHSLNFDLDRSEMLDKHSFSR